MSAKSALIIANTEYGDPGLSCLSAPVHDAEELERVLKARNICAFDDVKTLLNQPESVVRGAIDEFFDGKKSDDLLVLYFSGHGVRDEYGKLYLAVKDTNRFRLHSTAVRSDFIREAMDQSHSRRQVLILDCCNSGAFAQGTKAVTGGSMGISSAFEGTGYGHVVLTASDSTQFAWEGERIIGNAQNSLFTHFLVKGLEGEADLDGDGRITVDELYEYAYSEIVSRNPKQTPSKWSFKEQGEIVLREGVLSSRVKMTPLPVEIINAVESPLPHVREGAVRLLAELISGRNLGLARSAREVLEKMAADDDSRRVSQAANQALVSIKRRDEAVPQQEAHRVDEKPVPGLAQDQNVVKKVNRKAGREKVKHEKSRGTLESKKWFSQKWIKFLVLSGLGVMILLGAGFGVNALITVWRDYTPTPEVVVVCTPTSTAIKTILVTPTRTPTLASSRTPTMTATGKPQLTSTASRTRTPLPTWTWTPVQTSSSPYLTVSPLGDCSSVPQGTQCIIQVAYTWERASSGSQLCLYVESFSPIIFSRQTTLRDALIGDTGTTLGESFMVYMIETNDTCPSPSSTLPSHLQYSKFSINR